MATVDDLRVHLQQSRDRLVGALDGLSEYDVRRPLVPSGTNLLGLVKHLVGIEAGYLNDCVGRPAGLVLSWYDDGSVWEDTDMWATPEQSRDDVVGLYRQVWAASDASMVALPLDAPAEVPWWPAERRRTTFGHLLVRTLTDTAQHAGQADIVRETIVGAYPADDRDEAWWTRHRHEVQAAAEAFRDAT